MELRKIQRTSGGTFFVCLPKDWAERSGLSRGSIVSVSETANARLCIDPKYGAERAPQVAVVKPSPLLNREVIGNYLLGHDIVRVEAKGRISPDDRERVKRVSSRLIGLEIIEEDYSQIVLQSLLEPTSFPPEKILRREYLIASGMHRDAVTALAEGDEQLARNVIARDNEVDRLYFLLVRILRTVIQYPNLSEKLGISPIDCLDYRLVASFVEAIGDQSVQIAEKAVKLGGASIAKELLQLILKLHGVVHEAHENALRALFSHDISLAEGVRAEGKNVADLFSEIETLTRVESSEIAAAVLATVSSINRIYDHSVDIADLVIPKLT